MARRRFVGGYHAYPGGVPPEGAWERAVQYGRDILDGMITWGEMFGPDYEFKNNPRGSTVRSDYIGRPARWLNRKIGPETMLQAWADSTWDGDINNPNKPKNLGTWSQEVRKFREQVYGFKLDEKGNVVNYDSYGAAVVYTIIKGIMDFFKDIYELWRGGEATVDGKKTNIVGIKDRINNKIDRRRDAHLHGLDKSRITQKTVFNIDLDAFSGSQQGRIMRALTGEADLKEVAALPPEIRQMLDRLAHDGNDKCAVILTCNSPRARAICEANLAKLHTGQYAINANNGAFVAAVGADGALHQLQDIRIDNDAMTDLANYFIPGTAPHLGLAGKSNVDLLYHTPVNLKVKDVNGVDVPVTARIDWEMVVVDKKGKEHVIPIEPLSIPDPHNPRRMITNPNAANITSQLTSLDKDDCMSITFRPTKESIKKNVNNIVQNAKDKKAMTTQEQADLIYNMTQAGSSAFWLTFCAENSLLHHCRNLQIIPSSSGGFHLIPKGVGTYNCSSHNGAKFAATQMGFDPDNDMFNFLCTHESMSEPVSLTDKDMILELRRIQRLLKMKGTKRANVWDETLKEINSEQLMHKVTQTYKDWLYRIYTVKSKTTPVRKINKEVLDPSRLILIGDSSLTRRKLSLSIAGRAAGKWKKVLANSNSRNAVRMRNVNSIPSGSNFLHNLGSCFSNIAQR